MATSLQVIPVSQARTLLLQGQGLLSDPSTGADPDAVLRQIELLGFVQLDSINIVERAHHQILWTRLNAYSPETLDRLQRTRKIFEHWTHDASIIPTPWFPHWRKRFQTITWGPWLRQKLGKNKDAVLRHVLERIRSEGPLSARDFDRPGRKGGAWWDWKPAKAALEYWWRTGELAIPYRTRFEKLYDLTERVLPDVHRTPAPVASTTIDWACRGALERLGFATPREMASYWCLATVPEAAAWCSAAVKRGEIIAARCPTDPPTRMSYVIADWKQRLHAADKPPPVMRLLSPFDPLIRDRARCLRLFDFDYRFEAFVPQAKRKFGYYVMPILDGNRIVGRLDPQLDRATGELRIRRIWWEPTLKSGFRQRRTRLEAALDDYRRFLGASSLAVADWGRL